MPTWRAPIPKFVLIDHSICGLAGHHFEYASHVLRAAARAGYDAVLVTNRKFAETEQAPCRVLPVYEFGFWPEPAPSAALNSAVAWHVRLRKVYFQARVRLRFSRLGSAWLRHFRVRWFRPVHLLGVALLLALRLFRLALERLRKGGHQENAFERDTGTLLDQLEVSPEDVFFVPTVSAGDMLGLAGAIRRRPAAARASWHLLFRKNIYEGRREKYAAQDASLANLRRSFELYRETAGAARTCFYTDTEELTVQYDRLGVFAFRTLPIPHTYSPEDRVPHDGPPRITYLGDARREKGFHYLPRLMDDLRAGPPLPAHFAIQCNFNVPGGEPEAAVARDQLECLPARLVTLYKEPLTSAQYKNLLLSADINLLMYDARDYYARSSGILVESLAAGIPAIVPAASWLASQFLEPYYQHQEALVDRMTVLGRLPRIEWSPHGAAAGLAVPAGTTDLFVRIALAEGQSGALLTVTPLDEDGLGFAEAQTAWLEMRGRDNRATAVVPVGSEARALRLSLDGVGAGSMVRIASAQAAFLRNPPAAPLPVGAVGLIYHSSEELGRTLREMLRHYPHYRQTAVEFAGPWRAYHNPDRLIAGLAAATAAPVP